VRHSTASLAPDPSLAGEGTQRLPPPHSADHFEFPRVNAEEVLAALEVEAAWRDPQAPVGQGSGWSTHSCATSRRAGEWAMHPGTPLSCDPAGG